MNTENGAFQEFRQSLKELAGKAVRADLTDAERVKRAEATFARQLDGRMAVDLETCIHCGMCAEACHFYEATDDEKYAPVRKVEPLRRFYRRQLSPMRWFFRPFTRKLTVEELREWQPLVFDACTGCGRCDMMCPMGISLSPMIRVMRQGLASAGLMPDELLALDAEQSASGTVFGVGPDELKQCVEQLRKQGAEIPLDKEQADILVLTTAVEVKLFPDSLAATAKIMNKLRVNWMLSSVAFDATNVGLLAGDANAQKKASTRILSCAKACGARTVIVPEAGHSYQALRWEAANKVGEELPFYVVVLSEYIATELESGKLKLHKAADGKTVSYHDPCRLGRHGGIYEEPRDVLRALGVNLRETDSNRRENYCCGGGCAEFVIQRSAPLRQKAFEVKKQQFDDAQADAVITTCANCRINLMIGAENAGWGKPVGGLAELVAANLAD